MPDLERDESQVGDRAVRFHTQIHTKGSKQALLGRMRPTVDGAKPLRNKAVLN